MIFKRKKKDFRRLSFCALGWNRQNTEYAIRLWLAKVGEAQLPGEGLAEAVARVTGETADEVRSRLAREFPGLTAEALDV